MPLRFDLGKVGTVLCIGAHPDDIEIGCGATILHMLERNPELSVHWLVVGCSMDRKTEALDAFHAWCGKRPTCKAYLLEFEDTLFPSMHVEIKRAIHELSATVNPDLIFTHRREDLHQDHRTLAEITWNAFRNHLILEYEIVKYDGDLGNPNLFVPISKETAERKLELLSSLFFTQQSKPWYSSGTFEAIMKIRGVEAKSESGFAEAFHARKLWLS
jgi:LmbE family N-acetylglucosaminyl deacetylase